MLLYTVRAFRSIVSEAFDDFILCSLNSKAMFRKGRGYLARSLNSIAQIPRQILFRTDSLLVLYGFY